MATEASGLGPTIREAVHEVVRGPGNQGPASVALDHNENASENASENANDGAAVEDNDDIGGNLITHVGGSGRLHMRAILLDVDGDTLELIAAGDDDEIAINDDTRIQIPGQRPDDPRQALEDLVDDATDPVVVIIEGTCEDGGDCIATRVTVLGADPPGKPEGVGEGRPEGVGEGQPEGVGEGQPEGVGEGQGRPEGVGEGQGKPEGVGNPND